MDLKLVYQGLALLYTALTSLFRVLYVLPGAFIRCCCTDLTSRSIKDDTGSKNGQCFYTGQVVHTRRQPVHNAFQYAVRVAVVDLDHPPRWWPQQAGYHMTAAEAREFAGTTGRVSLLTDPISAGYVLNPISVYYCFSELGTLQTCIAEVTNTPWAERVTFTFDPKGEEMPKALHVSPLMDMKSTWRLRASVPGEDLQLTVDVRHPELGSFFHAGLHAKRAQRSGLANEEAGLEVLWRYGFQPQRVAILIYWQAIKLLWKGVSFYGPPSQEQQSEVQRSATSKAGKRFAWRPAQEFPWNLGDGSGCANCFGVQTMVGTGRTGCCGMQTAIKQM